jgi:hypothetical protein
MESTCSLPSSQQPATSPHYISKYNQQDATLRNLFLSMKCSTCFSRYICPSSRPQNCTYIIGYLLKLYCCLSTSWKSWNYSGRQQYCLDTYPMLYIQFWATDDGRRYCLKHAEHFTEINKLCNGASRWLYLEIYLQCTDLWTSNSSCSFPVQAHLSGKISLVHILVLLRLI